MTERFAILDLGSNTFHLLIVEPTKSDFTEIYRERVYTKLGKGGSSIILPESYKAGIECLILFKKLLATHSVLKYKAIGTAALRTSSNGAEFLAAAKEKAGIDIELIDGKQEASYIAKGVVQATELHRGHQWIMDIGGGSVEFILLENGDPIWMESYKVGLGILHSQFHKSEPLSSKHTNDLIAFLENELKPVVAKANEYSATQLIGASGSFEVIQNILDLQKWTAHSYRCHVLDFHKIKEKLLALDVEERIQVDGLPKERVDLIVVALILMDFAIKNLGIEELIISDFAMKEGLIQSVL